MRLFIFFGGLLVLALLAALIAPPFIDWNQFRDRFEREASRVTGQQVKVLGQTKARFLPLPSVTFEKVRVGDTKQPLLVADSFHINMELAPLLTGDVVIVDMELGSPRLDLRINEQGSLDWSSQTTRFPIDFSAADIALNKFTIVDGIVRVRDRRDQREIIVRDVELFGSAGTLAGPWRAEGELKHGARKMQVALSTGRWKAAENNTVKPQAAQIKVKLDVKTQTLPYDLTLDGPLTFSKGIPQFAGSFKVVPMTKQSASQRIAFDRSQSGRPIKGILDGVLKMGMRGAVVPDYKLRVGSTDDPYEISGTAFVNFTDDGSFEVNADGQQVNFARLEQETDGSVKRAKTLNDRLETLRSILVDLPQITAPGRINLSLPAVVADDTVVRNVAVGLSPLKGGKSWRLSGLEAELPGRTDIRADGDLRISDSLSYKGVLVLASRQPSGLAGWLSDNVPAPIRALSNGGMSAEVDLNAQELIAQNMELVLDGKRMTGSVRRSNADGIIDLNLRGDEVNFDALSALGEIVVGKPSNKATGLIFDVEADRLIADDTTARSVVAKGQMLNGDVVLDSLTIGDLAGVEVTAKGTVRRSSSPVNGALKVGVKARRANDVLALLQRRLGSVPLLGDLLKRPDAFTNSDLNFDIVAKDGRAAVKLTGVSGGTTVSSDMTWTEASRQLSVKAKLENPTSFELLTQLGFDVPPIDVGGSGKIDVSAVGSLDDVLQTKSSFSIAGLHGVASGDLSVAVNEDDMVITGPLDVDVRADDLDPIISLSGIGMPGFGEGIGGELRAALLLGNDSLRADDLTIRYGDLSAYGALIGRPQESGRTSILGNLASEQADVETLAGLVFGVPQSGGNRPLSGVDGTVKLTISSLEAVGGLSLKDISTTAKLKNGDVDLQDLMGEVFAGQLNGKLSLARAGKAKVLNGQVSIADMSLERFAQSVGHKPVVTGKANLQLSFDSAAETNADLVKGLSGGGVIAVSKGILQGLSSSAFVGLLKYADGTNGDSISLSEDDLRRAGLFDGSLELPKLDIPFSIASGTLRTSNVNFDTLGANASVAVRASLDDLEGSYQLALNLDAGKETIAGAPAGVTLTFEGKPAALKRVVNATALETYLGQRSAGRRERKFLAQQAAILERQRLGRSAQALVLEKDNREKRAAEKAERLKALEAEQADRSNDAKVERIRELLLDSITGGSQASGVPAN